MSGEKLTLNAEFVQGIWMRAQNKRLRSAYSMRLTPMETLALCDLAQEGLKVKDKPSPLSSEPEELVQRLHRLSNGPGELQQACWDAMERIQEQDEENRKQQEQLEDLKVQYVEACDRWVPQLEKLEAQLSAAEERIEGIDRHEQTLRDNGINGHGQAIALIFDLRGQLSAAQQRAERLEEALGEAEALAETQAILSEIRVAIAEEEKA